MTHFDGSQEQDLLQTATFIVNNQANFSSPIIRWSEAFVAGGISNPTFQELLNREDISIIPTVGGTDLIIIQDPQEISAIDTTQSENLIGLGESSVRISESLDQIQKELLASLEANREFTSEVNTRLSASVTELGKSLQQQANDEAAEGFFGGITTFLGGIGAGGLIAVAVIGFFVLRGKI